MYRNLINTIFYVFLSQFVFSQQYDFEKLDNYFDSLKENNRFMGTVAISKGNELIYKLNLTFSLLPSFRRRYEQYSLNELSGDSFPDGGFQEPSYISLSKTTIPRPKRILSKKSVLRLIV